MKLATQSILAVAAVLFVLGVIDLSIRGLWSPAAYVVAFAMEVFETEPHALPLW
jgi:hypothetical protein